MPSTRPPRPESLPHAAEAPELVGLVLAAGLGTRLRPLTERVAKAVVPFLGRPSLHWALDRVAEAGAARIGVNAHHLGEQVEACARAWGREREERGGVEVPVEVVYEATLLGTGGGARGIWEALGCPRATAVVVNGDVIVEEPLAAALTAHRRAVADEGAIATLVCSAEGEGRVFVADEVGRGGRVVGLPGPGGPAGETAGLERSFVGTSFLEPEALALLPRGPGCLLRQGLVASLGPAGRLRSYLGEGRAVDLGTPERYWRATRGALDAAARGRADAEDARRIVGPDVGLGAGVVLGDYVVLSGCTRVAAGARLARVVAHDAELAGDIDSRLIVGETALALPEVG